MLNDNEINVLHAIMNAHGYNGGDFTYHEDVMDFTDLTSNQVKGYLSQLQSKKYITICTEYHQINFLKKSIEIIPSLEDFCEVY